MRRAFQLFVAALSCVALMGLYGCKKDSGSGAGHTVPTVTTAAIYNIYITSFSSGGTVTDDGGSGVTARGICWNTAGTPTVNDSKTADGAGTGSFVSNATGLTVGTTYYVRAYATNAVGTAYGSQLTVQAGQGYSVPTVQIGSVIASSSYVLLQSTVVSQPDRNLPITARGVCYGTSPNPTVSGSRTSDSTGYGSFLSTVSGLKVNTTYYFRAYATNAVGTGYSAQSSAVTAYYVGQNYGGGKIFYIDATKLHGLIMTSEDQSSGAQWDGTNRNIPTIGAGSASDGAANTARIISVLGTSTAAGICAGCRDGSYTDWYLPSANEMAALYRAVPTIYPYGNGAGYPLPGEYWTSTESNYEFNAYAIGPALIVQNYYTNQYLPVRAIRKF